MSNPVGAQRYGLGGGDAYYDAVKYGGYTGTREQFGRDQAEFAQNATAVAQAKEEVERNTQTVVNTSQTFTEETVPAAIQSVEEKGDTEEDRLEARTTELVQSINTAGAVQVQAVEDEGTEQIRLVSGAGTAQVEAVEQAGSDQVDAVEAAGSTQVGNVNNAGSTQISAVNSEGSTQVQAVQDKGTEVLNSIPSDYTELTEDVDNLKNAVGDIDSELTDGIFVQYANGVETSVQSYSCTDYIPCAGMKIYVKTEIATNDTAGIVFYDGAKNYISGFNPHSHNYTLFELEIPDTAVYVRISCLVRYKASFIVECRDFINQTAIRIGNIGNDISAQSEAISKLNSIKSGSKNILPTNGRSVTFAGVTMSYDDGVITYNGTATGSGGRTLKLITPVTLLAGNYTLWAENGVSPIFIENATGDTIITNIAVNNAWKSTFTLESETTLYIGSNVENGTIYNGRTVNVMLESGSTKTEYEAPSFASAIDLEARKGLLALQTFWAYAMGKILCIGDSLTSGACFTGSWNGASIDQNYPRLLGRMLNADVTNAGVSGLSASEWYTNEISKYTLANYDTFIIWLGTNDGLTDTLDTDVNPYTDYNDFANTNTGNYCKIIEKIKADNPDCMIILTKVFVSDTTNTVIDKIAAKYSLPVVDNSDLTIANYPALHGNINNVHFTKTGNLFIADRYVKKMAEVFADNPASTNYGLTARTN